MVYIYIDERITYTLPAPDNLVISTVNLARSLISVAFPDILPTIVVLGSPL